jgi:hypothetical protein
MDSKLKQPKASAPQEPKAKALVEAPQQGAAAAAARQFEKFQKPDRKLKLKRDQRCHRSLEEECVGLRRGGGERSSVDDCEG